MFDLDVLERADERLREATERTAKLSVRTQTSTHKAVQALNRTDALLQRSSMALNPQIARTCPMAHTK